MLVMFSRGQVLAALLIGFGLAYWCRDTFHPESVRGKRVLITGASTGIGEQLAYQYAAMGARVVITARTEDRLKKVVSECKKRGSEDGDYYYMTADMTDLLGTKKLIQFAHEKLGGLDILLLNHIAIIPLLEWHGTDDNFRDMNLVHNVNFMAYVHLATYAMLELEVSRGSIVVVSSIAGKMGQPYLGAYSGYKHALHGFFNSLRMELNLREVPVSITTCVIGLIGTENALTNLRNFNLGYMIDLLKPARPEDAALAIVKGSSKQAREIYFPYWEAKLVTLLRDWFPEVLDQITSILYQKPS